VITARDRNLRVVAGAHEATKSSRQRTLAQDWGSGNRIAGMDAKQLRTSARQLCRDHDLAKSVFNVLVQNCIGTGIDIIPAPRQRGVDSRVDTALADDLRWLWSQWWDRPEVTWQHDYGKCQQLLFGGMVRDGESFNQSIVGIVPYLDHGTQVPFSLELIESDLVPLDYSDDKKNILQGAERNGWGRVVAWWLYKHHPGDGNWYRDDLKRVSADQLRQFANIDRMHQVRGLSIFAPVMNRLVDISDIENSERIAAKVAASFCAQIIKGDATLYQSPDVLDQVASAASKAYRAMSMVPGMIGDDLLPGEKIETIASNRPNPNLADYLNDQVRRIAGGTGASHSSVSHNYDGTYSAQRQELIESFGAYAMLSEQFTARVLRPHWNDFVQAAVLANLVKLPKGWTLQELSAAAFIKPVMPWIDPLKEALARAEFEDRGWQAPQQSILQTGNDPDEVKRLREDWAAQGNALPGVAAAPAPTDPNADPSAPAGDAGARHARRGALLEYALKDNP
jgi:lambda family phage portal protein